MSFDRQIDQVCTHQVVEEPLLFLDNRRTLLPIRPISSTDSLVIRLNGDIEAPSTGVHVPASTRGRKLGPFKVEASSNTLRLSVQGGAVLTATLPLSTHMTTDQVVGFLNQAFPSVLFKNDRNAVAFESILTGEDSTVYVVLGSTLATLLGIPLNREYRGKMVLPGWTLAQKPGTLADRGGRMILFDEPLKGYQDFAEVNYTTVRTECRRCGGTGVENDWRYGIDGNTVEVRDEALLIQEVNKAIYTSRGSNPFHTWYGSTIIDQIGTKAGATGFVQNMILSDIQSTFTRWLAIKSQQEKNVGQFVSDSEFPSRILSMKVEQSRQDPTVFFVHVTIQNRSREPIQLTRGIRLPQSSATLGDNTPNGVFRQSLRDFSLVG